MSAAAKAFSEVARLEGRKVFLVPFTEACAEESYQAYLESREELRRFMPWENRSVADARLFAARSEAGRAEGTQLHMAVRERASGRMLGTIGVHHLDPFTPRGEIGYWIRTAACGNGFATDAVATFLAFLRGPCALKRVSAKVAAANLASQRVLAKNGFTEEGFEPRGELCHGVWNDLKLYGRLFP